MLNIVLASPISKVNAWMVSHLVRNYIGPIGCHIGLSSFTEEAQVGRLLQIYYSCMKLLFWHLSQVVILLARITVRRVELVWEVELCW